MTDGMRMKGRDGRVEGREDGKNENEERGGRVDGGAVGLRMQERMDV